MHFGNSDLDKCPPGQSSHTLELTMSMLGHQNTVKGREWITLVFALETTK